MTKTCWIIGASAGIGAALAQEFKKQGYNLILSARSEDKLKKVAKSVGMDGTIILPFDVSDLKDFTQAKESALKKFKTIDLAIYAPAIYKPMSVFDSDIKFVQDSLDINLGGCFNFLHLIVPVMKKQNNGHIGLISSVAGYCGLPNSYVYGATKAAMINLAEGIKPELARENIKLSLINPGFVDTRLTKKNKFKMPFIINQEDAAKAIISGLNKGKFEIHFPKKLTLILKFLRLLPYNIYFAIIGKIS